MTKTQPTITKLVTTYFIQFMLRGIGDWRDLGSPMSSREAAMRGIEAHKKYRMDYAMVAGVYRLIVITAVTTSTTEIEEV